MNSTRNFRLITAAVSTSVLALTPGALHALEDGEGTGSETTDVEGRIIEADIVAMDQAITYNRFGSINPYGMIFALRSDVVKIPSDVQTQCTPGTETPIGDLAGDAGAARDANFQLAGNVRLRCDKRPRPLVLRGNVGDVLVVRMTNLLLPEAPDASSCDKEECQGPYPDFRQSQEVGDGHEAEDGPDANWPHTRLASLAIPGLRLREGTDPRCTALESIAPGETLTCSYDLTRQGSFLFQSSAAPAGGEADSGSAIHGLFGAVNVQPRHSRWYRSQVDQADFDAVWGPQAGDPADPLMTSAARPGTLDYDSPLLSMLDKIGDGRRYRLRYGDINAVVEECTDEALRNECRVTGSNMEYDAPELTRAECDALPGDCLPSYREFTVVFHDELKTFYAEPFRELETEGQLAGIGDGFAINYGASGMGSILLANRKGIGPARDCVECMYEEFFLQSWANGDPALLEGYEDDPSNVHHSYLNDRVVFRNLHVGKETHVFHLHAHQWEALDPEQAQGSYLDSQTIGPGQAFTYEIYRGGLRHYGSDYNVEGGSSGNRNHTVGDSIFHCHLYPHFAQGMWALWRVHDVVEDGSRRLPDGQAEAGLSYDLAAAAPGQRVGTDPLTGQMGDGTPIPAVIPLPGQPLPPLPTYGPEGLPGYPFYIAGEAGHRAPQPPGDFADVTDADGGLPRHVIESGVRGMAHLKSDEIDDHFGGLDPIERGGKLLERALVLADMTAELEEVTLRLLDPGGTPEERRSMDFHAGLATRVRSADGTLHTLTGGYEAGYPSKLPDSGLEAAFSVNGSAPAPGAPFADPCRFRGVWDPANPDGTMRTYNVSAVQMDLVTNRDGWHDPQARINVLTQDVDDYLLRTRGAEPFFFRAESGECITFNHSNRTPKDLDLDDFQVATPTDTIGQHIHLVKFDVTSSDGSGNGWNYEDGTFAPDAVLERLCAAREGAVLDGTLATDEALCDAFHAAETAAQRFEIALPHHVQTTTQRWFADPLLGRAVDGSDKSDRTLGTVFTHDHFAPSSIQQHGFYSALLVEPKGSEWLRPDRSEMPRDLADSGAVGAKALIVGAEDRAIHPDTREFALAIADFALLYDPACAEPPCVAQISGDFPNDAQTPDPWDAVDPAEEELAENGFRRGLDLLLKNASDPRNSELVFAKDITRLAKRRNTVRAHGGWPVAPPLLPESISVDHHDPYLVNYRGEPVPLRVGDLSYTDLASAAPVTRNRLTCAFLNGPGLAAEDLAVLPATRTDLSRRRDGNRGELAFAFASDGPFQIGHGDPCTPILNAFEGERVGIRLVQGAQEVQHVFTVEGMGWPRLEHYTGSIKPYFDNPMAIVGAQEVGISEHLEFAIPRQAGLSAGQHADFLMHFGSQDAIWNGAWGLLRVNNGVEGVSGDLAPLYGGDGLAYVRCGNVKDPTIGPSGAGPDGQPIYADCLASNEVTGQIEPTLGLAPQVHIWAIAASVAQMGWDDRAYRTAAPALTDPDGLVLLPSPEIIDAQRSNLGAIIDDLSASPLSAPPVWRVNAGSIIKLNVVNALSPSMGDQRGDALLPRIVSVNTDDPDNADHDIGADHIVSFSIPVLPQYPAAQVGNFVGHNARDNNGVPYPRHADPSSGAADFRAEYYAGRLNIAPVLDPSDDALCDVEQSGGKMACAFRADAMPYAYGPLPIKPLGDVFGQLSHGLFAGLVIEPEGSRTYDPRTGASMDALALPADPDFPPPYQQLFAGGQGTSAIVCTATDGSESGPVTRVADCAGGEGFREFVVFYQDGMNLHRPDGDTTRPVVDCAVCDDSYDRGEKGLSYSSEPMWARLDDGSGRLSADSNLNTEQFPADFLAQSGGAIATPVYTALEGETVKFRVIQPGGRARQRSFEIVGNDYPDTMPFAVDANGDPATSFGSPAAALLGPGKAITATLTCVQPGTYLYRDGPTHFFSGGVWGHFVVEAASGDGAGSSCSVTDSGE
ncbi:hypothetical protein [Aurantiacibacter rhizosphaerae]|uniref:Copper oxidase n=1 Tax=Aurantiacibacter rhizosphaerae TaxID=2691582 RepID=A0A844XG13_9SPHN|nr:hypothetical protein [Aurantiacibacter rhizosphaerae]MWV28679.1 hypothetical protein [Aurantiacibacter rhizosphaerae]